MKAARHAKKRAAPTPVVFLHGLGGSSADWEPCVSRLADRFRAVVPDLPGSSLSPGAHRGWQLPSLARWVADLLHAEGLTRPHVVGHSLGARIAGELAANGTAASILLVAPLGATGYSLTDRLKWKAMSRTAILRSVPESQMRRALSYGFVKEGPGKAGFVARALAARTGPHAVAATEAIERSVDGVLEAPPLSDRLLGTRLPVGIVSGGVDPLVPPADAAKILDARSDARLFVLPAQGHYPMLDDPAAFASLVERFLDLATS
jgi:pimeloyl-ACP methyl ester carboxylesterase